MKTSVSNNETIILYHSWVDVAANKLHVLKEPSNYQVVLGGFPDTLIQKNHVWYVLKVWTDIERSYSPLSCFVEDGAFSFFVHDADNSVVGFALVSWR